MSSRREGSCSDRVGMTAKSAERYVEVLQVPQGGRQHCGAGEQVLQVRADRHAGGGGGGGRRVQLHHLVRPHLGSDLLLAKVGRSQTPSCRIF